MSGDGDSAGLLGVLELPMAAALSYLVPAIIMDEAQNISRLHYLCQLVYRSISRKSQTVEARWRVRCLEVNLAP